MTKPFIRLNMISFLTWRPRLSAMLRSVHRFLAILHIRVLIQMQHEIWFTSGKVVVARGTAHLATTRQSVGHAL